MSSSGCGPYLTPSSLPVLQPAYLSSASCTSLACVPLALVLFAHSPSVQLLLCVGVEALAPNSPHALLTLKRKVSKVQEQDGNSLLPSLTFRMGLWETEAFQAPIAAYCTPHHLHKGLGWSVPSAGYLPAREFWTASCCPLEGGWRGDRMASPKALGCRIAC